MGINQVVDPNIVISALLGIGNSYKVFDLNNVKQKFNFISPYYFLVELGSKTEKIAKKTKFSLEEVQEVLRFIVNQITFIPESEYENKIKEARQILKSNEEDVPYLALALKYNCEILSGDKLFKKFCPEKVKNPKEILRIFYSN